MASSFSQSHLRMIAPPVYSTRPLVSREAQKSTPVQIQNHRECMVITKLGHTSRPVTDLTQRST